MTMTVERGKEYRVRGKRGKYAALDPIHRDGEVAGWWMRGENGTHAFRNEQIRTRKGRK